MLNISSLFRSMQNLTVCEGESQVDFKYLVNLALDQKVSWILLKGFLDGLTNNFETAKQLNSILFDELQSLHLKHAEKNASEEEETLGNVQEPLEGDDLQVQHHEKMIEDEHQVSDVEDVRCNDNDINPNIEMKDAHMVRASNFNFSLIHLKNSSSQTSTQ